MKKIYLSVIALMFISSCTNDDLYDNSNNKSHEQYPVIIYQDRDPGLRTDITTFDDVVKTKSGTIIDVNNYIGHRYAIGNGTMGDRANVRSGLFDISKIREERPTWLTSIGMKSTNVSTIAFANTQRYEEKTTDVETVTSGFKLNLKFFSIGKTNTIKNTFITHTIDDSRSTMAEAKIDVVENKHTISLLPHVQKLIAAKYIYKDFKQGLYYNTIDQILENDGDFVVVGYYTGGKVVADYIFESKESVSYETEEREEDTSIAISASYKWGGKDSTSASANFGFGGEYSDFKGIEEKFSQAAMNVRAQGGSKDIAVKVDNLLSSSPSSGVDLSNWLRSLNDESTHIFAGLIQGEGQQRGLSPVASYVLEENFQRRLQDTHMEYLSTNRLEVPKIVIARVFEKRVSGENRYKIVPILKTRHGDNVILGDGSEKSLTDAQLMENNNHSVFMAKANTIASDMTQYFQTEIRIDPNERIYPYKRVPLTVDFDGIDLGNMETFSHPETGMMYMYDFRSRLGFAIYKSRILLSDNGIEQWVRGMPEDDWMDIEDIPSIRFVGL